MIYNQEIKYPYQLENYKHNMDYKIYNALQEVNDSDDIRISLDVDYFSFECKKIELEIDSIEEDLYTEINLYQNGRPMYVRRFYNQKDKFEYIIKLKYSIYITWKRRPYSFTDWFTKQIQNNLNIEGIDFTAEDICWVEDTSTGQIFTQKYTLNCDKIVTEEEAKEIQSEYIKLNGEA